MSAPSVAFLTQYDENGASTRIRICQFLPYFEKAGYQVTLMPLVSRDGQNLMNRLAVEKKTLQFVILVFGLLRHFLKRYRDVLRAWKYDAAIVQKDVLPFGLRSLLKLGQKNIIFEFDDAIWSSHKSSGSAPGLAKLMTLYRRHLLNQMLKCSRAVIVDNEYLAQYARRFNAQVHILAAPIDTNLYKVERQLGLPPKLGWIGSPGTSYLLSSILPALEKLGQERPIVLINIGGLPLSSQQIQILNIPWSIANELHWLGKMDLGLMPLDDTEFNRGKLGYKIVQYFSAGIPVLATAVGLNPDYIKDGQNGYCFKEGQDDDFVTKAKLLLDNTKDAVQMGYANRVFAETEFDTTVLAQRFIEIVREIIVENPVLEAAFSAPTRLKH